MVFTVGQTTAFFTDNDQMGIPAATVAQLAQEGITTVADLEEFDDTEFDQIIRNLRNPPRIPDPANPGVLIAQGPFVLSAKSLKRLKIASHAVRYYTSIDRDLTPGNMHYTNTLKNFELQWNSLCEKGDADQPDVPKITRNTKITRWSESFQDFLARSYGVRKAPLSYIIRENVNVDPVPPPLLHRRPHSDMHGSVEGELIARLDHTSPLYRDDNQQVYHLLEEATRSTVYSASLKPFQRMKDGRAAYLALIAQHAGDDKWEKELKEQESLMKSRVWKGNSNFSLERFIDQHRAAHISMQQCAEHVPFQLPDEHTRVRYLMDGIQCNDAELQAALAAIRMDTVGPNAKRNNFENAAAFLLPTCPVAKKRKSNNTNRTATISGVGAEAGTKAGVGKTGVELRYYKKAEYKQLSEEQKVELKEWRAKNVTLKTKKRKVGDGDGPQGDENDGAAKKKWRREVASVIREEIKKREDTAQKDQEEVESIKELLVSFAAGKAVQAKPAPSQPTNPSKDSVTVAATKLQSILKNGRGKSKGE